MDPTLKCSLYHVICMVICMGAGFPAVLGVDSKAVCPENQYYVIASKTGLSSCHNCTTCDPGLQPTPGVAGTCPGNRSADRQCESCLNGTHKEAPGNHKCIPCTIFTACPKGKYLVNECNPIHDGHCYDCPKGKFKDEETENCEQCSICCSQYQIPQYECYAQGLPKNMSCYPSSECAVTTSTPTPLLIVTTHIADPHHNDRIRSPIAEIVAPTIAGVILVLLVTVIVVFVYRRKMHGSNQEDTDSLLASEAESGVVTGVGRPSGTGHGGNERDRPPQVQPDNGNPPSVQTNSHNQSGGVGALNNVNIYNYGTQVIGGNLTNGGNADPHQQSANESGPPTGPAEPDRGAVDLPVSGVDPDITARKRYEHTQRGGGRPPGGASQRNIPPQVPPTTGNGPTISQIGGPNIGVNYGVVNFTENGPTGNDGRGRDEQNNTEVTNNEDLPYPQEETGSRGNSGENEGTPESPVGVQESTVHQPDQELNARAEAEAQQPEEEEDILNIEEAPEPPVLDVHANDHVYVYNDVHEHEESGLNEDLDMASNS